MALAQVLRDSPILRYLYMYNMQSVLAGDTCLYGGQGWWKYEYCHGKKVSASLGAHSDSLKLLALQVIQFHDFNDGKTPRTEILLGKWDEAAHRRWVAEHSHKTPVKVL